MWPLDLPAAEAGQQPRRLVVAGQRIHVGIRHAGTTVTVETAFRPAPFCPIETWAVGAADHRPRYR
jgi:hypothetical protein